MRELPLKIYVQVYNFGLPNIITQSLIFDPLVMVCACVRVWVCVRARLDGVHPALVQINSVQFMSTWVNE